jgi:hypothetical protein
MEVSVRAASKLNTFALTSSKLDQILNLLTSVVQKLNPEGKGGSIKEAKFSCLSDIYIKKTKPKSNQSGFNGKSQKQRNHALTSKANRLASSSELEVLEWKKSIIPLQNKVKNHKINQLPFFSMFLTVFNDFMIILMINIIFLKK